MQQSNDVDAASPVNMGAVRHRMARLSRWVLGPVSVFSMAIALLAASIVTSDRPEAVRLLVVGFVLLCVYSLVSLGIAYLSLRLAPASSVADQEAADPWWLSHRR